MRTWIVALLTCWLWPACLPAQGPAHVVFLVGESEYGSADTMAAFAKRLSTECSLRTTVLQSRDRELPPLDALESADLLVMFLRFRTASDSQFATLQKWFDAGKPCVALRTTSHAFSGNQAWFPPLFGGHYKAHAPNDGRTFSYVPAWNQDHALLRGIPRAIEMGHGGTYNTQPLADQATVILLGRTDELPCEPIAWTYAVRPEQRIFYTSLGSRENFARPDFQRLLGNAVWWALGKEVPANGVFEGGEPRAAVAIESLPAPPNSSAPDDAKILFAGENLNEWRHWDPSAAPRAIAIDTRADTSTAGSEYAAPRWPIEAGAMVARPGFGDVVTKEAFGNYHLHVDFCLPLESGLSADARSSLSAFRGRSGIFLAGRYEVEIADAFGEPLGERSLGAIYGQHSPDQEAARPAGEWQSLDIHYRHCQGQRPVVNAWLNGVQIHDRITLRERTTYGFLAAEPGSQSAMAGEGARLARPPAQSFAFGGGNFTIAARFRSKHNGTIAAKCPLAGEWRPNSVALFLRDGRLVYDIGWVGQMQTTERLNDGKWHRVVLTHDDGKARMFVDGALACEREAFVTRHEPEHVFKIGTAATDFGGVYHGEISDVVVLEHNLDQGKAVQWSRGEVVNLGEPCFDWQPEEVTPADGSSSGPKPVLGPIRLQADSARVRFANIWLRQLGDVDHAKLARANADAVARGLHVFDAACSRCHGNAKQHFAAGLKNGSDAFAIYRTLEHGAGHKQAIAWLPPKARYDAIHYLREQLQLPSMEEGYYASLPAGLPESRASHGSDEVAVEPARATPPYVRMDYGNALHWTYQVADQNIVQKGIAVRLDAGEGGVSRGRSFAVFDHDTMRLAACWSGEGFIDWRGVAFDGSHNSHAHVRGEVLFAAPNEPGWAHPQTGSWRDERIVGRDGKRYGPLPKSWLRFLGRRQFGEQSVFEYTVGDVPVREMPGCHDIYGTQVFTRRLEVGSSQHDLSVRLMPDVAGVACKLTARDRDAVVAVQDGWHVMRIAAGSTVGQFLIQMTAGDSRLLSIGGSAGALPAWPTMRDATLLWPQIATTEARMGTASGGFAVDELPVPDGEGNAHHSWMRLGGFDFYADGKRAAVATWNGDVWLVSGVGEQLGELRWRRIAAGLFQPLGVRIVNDVVYVSCRDQICMLEDSNQDGETDFYRCFNNDHQVTEHFHEFAMGLQDDRDGNFYYAKSARHALTALVPHHGTLLQVSPDGSNTEIVANGFRAANGVCVNDDGTFYVTDQEGHWTPKNRINKVIRGGFYGNMFGYHDQRSDRDEDMQQPLVWLTNAFDRSPAELVRVVGSKWGVPAGSLVQLSYGMGRAFLVLEDEVDGIGQGAMVAMPIPEFATGVMRGRFHPDSGQLYCCGLYGWSGARTRPGGFYRVRYVGGAIAMPTALRVIPGGLQLTFGVALDATIAAELDSYSFKTWSLRRSKNYGSSHHDEQQLIVESVTLQPDQRTVQLAIRGLLPTMCYELLCDLETATGEPLRAKIHGTLHQTK